MGGEWVSKRETRRGGDGEVRGRVRVERKGKKGKGRNKEGKTVRKGMKRREG